MPATIGWIATYTKRELGGIVSDFPGQRTNPRILEELL